eukprot:CAMPEP_0116027424 /NCGR_PEP_ID=MMETSP0321-20121206/14639_1 /TAXON_ID=163516 /ORGANISM="Leptocylindrus danicus var. danicus, Strain B650" /LENGTH=321 /DNA_ID=CAMNT_0003500813 /DNA_START=50 /DNA_END=1015 /DNA_ORIENTATION=-
MSEEAPRRSKKKSSVPIMGESGQTDAERRKLRTSQRKLHKQITTAEGDAMEDAKATAFDQIRDTNNALFKKVRYAREAVLDGENLDAITTRASRQADRLVSVARYDAAKFVRKLKSKATNREHNFDWTMLGREVGTCFNAVPGINFMNGPVDHHVAEKKRVVRERRKRGSQEEGEEERPEDLKEMEKGDGRLTAAEHHYKSVRETLIKRSSEVRKEEQRNGKKQKGEINMVQYLFNPKSFTQTVENIFHYSFLVKKGDAGVRVDSKSGGVTTWNSYVKDDGEQLPSRQCIVALDRNQWQALIDSNGVIKSDVPHRTGKNAR